MIYENIPPDFAGTVSNLPCANPQRDIFLQKKGPYQVENSSHNPSISDTLLLSVIYCKGR